MTYRVERWVSKIKSPIIVECEDSTFRYNSGNDFATSIQDKPYTIESISAVNNIIVIKLMKNQKINDTSWSKDAQSFF